MVHIAWLDKEFNANDWECRNKKEVSSTIYSFEVFKLQPQF